MNQKHLYNTIDYTPLIKARNTLHRVLETAQSEGEKMGVVKAFEFCYELSWKILKKILIFHSIEVSSARDVFREATKIRLIEDPEKWFSYLDKGKTRNVYIWSFLEKQISPFIAIRKKS